MYEQYLLERYKGSRPPPYYLNLIFKPIKFKDIDYFSKLKKISELDDEHTAKQVVIKRQIPTEYHDKLYLCNKFMSFVNEVKPNTFSHTKGEHQVDNAFFTEMMAKHLKLSGRAFGKEQPKYLTIKFDENKQKVFGLDKVNLQDNIFIVEGPIDSMFIDNCLAMAVQI